MHDAGEAPLATLRLLEKTLRNQSPAAERRASALAYQLLVVATSGACPSASEARIRDAVRILDVEWNQPISALHRCNSVK